MSILEKEFVTLGFVALSDCAPLVIAKEKGFFKEQSLEVQLSKEPSWSNIRDKVAFELLDGAQMLAPMPIASNLGIEGWKKPMVTAYSLSLNGNAITVSNALYQQMHSIAENNKLTANELKPIIKASTKPLCFAVVHPFSCHNYLLRDWLSQAGINPDKDIQLIVIPPAQMVEHLKAGLIDGFCVGAPWNTQAEELGIGHIITSSYDIYPNHPEKVFGVNLDWAKKYPLTYKAILNALSQASHWLGQTANIDEIANILAQPEYLGLSVSLIKTSLTRSHLIDENGAKGFYDNNTDIPQVAHAKWIIEQMIRWGQINQALNIEEVISKIYYPQLDSKILSVIN